MRNHTIILFSVLFLSLFLLNGCQSDFSSEAPNEAPNTTDTLLPTDTSPVQNTTSLQIVTTDLVVFPGDIIYASDLGSVTNSEDYRLFFSNGHFSASYEKPGTYHLSLTAEDSAGNRSEAMAQVTVVLPQKIWMRDILEQDTSLSDNFRDFLAGTKKVQIDYPDFEYLKPGELCSIDELLKLFEDAENNENPACRIENISYALIDCGGDSLNELALSFQKNRQLESETLTVIMIEQNDELLLTASKLTWSRSEATLYTDGYWIGMGSGGAADSYLHMDILDHAGKLNNIYDCHISYNVPGSSDYFYQSEYTIGNTSYLTYGKSDAELEALLEKRREELGFPAKEPIHTTPDWKTLMTTEK